MKKPRSSIARLALVFLVVAGFVPLAPAQPAQRQQGLGAGERLFPMLNRVLTDEQRSSLRSALEPQRDKMQPLEEKLRVSRRAMLDAITSGKFDETAARQNAEQSAKAEAELTVIFAKALSEMKPPLSAQQIEQMKNFQPGQAQPQAAPQTETPPEPHLALPAPLPRDTNDLPVVK